MSGVKLLTDWIQDLDRRLNWIDDARRDTLGRFDDVRKSLDTLSKEVVRVKHELFQHRGQPHLGAHEANISWLDRIEQRLDELEQAPNARDERLDRFRERLDGIASAQLRLLERMSDLERVLGELRR